MSLLSDFWDDAVGGAEWLKDVILGEFHEDQTPSEIVAGLMVSFVPGAVIVLSARDMTAVIIRMIRHPERRGEVMQWMIIVACAMGLVPALIGAAAGAAAAGVGAIVGGLAGDELGAAIRATCLVLIENTGRLLERLVEFIRRFVHGNILGFLRELRLAEYAKPVVDETVKFIGHLAGITRRVIVKAQSVRWIGSVGHLIEKLEALEKGFYQIQREAVHKLPMAIDELQSRLGRALSEHMAQAEHPVHPNHPAPHPPAPHPPEPRRVTASEHPPLGTPPGLEPPRGEVKPVDPEENLHPQGVKADLHRPYIRKSVRAEVEARAPRTADGKFIDPNTGEAIDGPYDLGHVPGHEFWREQEKAEAEGLTQQEFNDRMNNPDYYQIESPSSNRSHRFEQKD